jgi:hypothetical protein
LLQSARDERGTRERERDREREECSAWECSAGELQSQRGFIAIADEDFLKHVFVFN